MNAAGAYSAILSLFLLFLLGWITVQLTWLAEDLGATKRIVQKVQAAAMAPRPVPVLPVHQLQAAGETSHDAEAPYVQLSDLVEGASTHQEWLVRRSNPHLDDHRLPCRAAPATEANARGVEAVNRYVSGSWQAPLDLAAALANFSAATTLEEGCTSARFNFAITLLATNKWVQGCAIIRRILEEGHRSHPSIAKLGMYSGFCSELEKLEGSTTASDPLALYRQAFTLQPALAAEYFGIYGSEVPPRRFFGQPDRKLDAKVLRSFSVPPLVTFLLAKEYGTYAIDGYPTLDRRAAISFAQVGFYHIPNMLPPIMLREMQLCYRRMVSAGVLAFNDGQATRYHLYNDPVGRFVQAQYAFAVSRLADRPVKPTYTYFGGYVGGSVLAPHLDRLQCEYTLTMQIDMDPPDYIWPFKVDVRALKAGGKPTKLSPAPPRFERTLYLRPGDGGLIWGRRINHYRDDKLPPGHRSHNIFLHFVHREFNGSLN
eukprot:TRINITY_DN13319_c0_g1_i1.p1 TRINITY_DN13319_c0_g1~~TRINITY_DN13319_c0_g1_i1.p1  ORF type:complete len:497 (-),score=69.03 TRINITY_DN13319_c0_g1_i1:11-1465(-)